MNEPLQTILWNTILPMILLCGLVTLMPRILVPRANLSQTRLAVGIALAAFFTLLAGAVLAAVLYASLNPGTLQQIAKAPLARTTFFLDRSTLFALLWALLLAFVWLVKAQDLNRRIGLRMVDERAAK